VKGLVPFAREHLGLEFYPRQRQVLARWSKSGKRKAVLALGRRSGKDLMAASASIYNAVVEDYTGYLRPGEQRFIVPVATRVEQARELIRFTKELLANAPDRDLSAMLDSEASTLDEVVFRNGVTVRAMPCSSRSSRGLPISLLILNEAAHMMTTEDGYAAGQEVYRALQPSTAQFGDRGYVMVMSSPKWCSGIFWDLFSAGISGGAEDTFVAQHATWEMNPTITRKSLEADFQADPESARAEYGAEFIEGAGAYLPAGQISACRKRGRQVLPPAEGVWYVAAADPAFAAGGDAFTFSIGHRVGSGDSSTVVIDRIDSWRGKRSPLNSDKVLDEIAALAKSYGIRRVISDQYAVVPLADGLKRRGIKLVPQPLHNELKADIFGTLKRLLNMESIELPDDPALASELINLQIRPTPSGKPHIAASAGHKDDRAMVVATVAHALFKPTQGRAFTEAWERMAAAAKSA
jgi:hypothetical protein